MQGHGVLTYRLEIEQNIVAIFQAMNFGVFFGVVFFPKICRSATYIDPKDFVCDSV